MPSDRSRFDRLKLIAQADRRKRDGSVCRTQAPDHRGILVALNLIVMFCIAGLTAAGQSGPAGTSVARLARLPQPATSNSNPDAPLTLTLQDALKRAKAYSPQFQAAVTATKMARQNVVQARATLLPSADATTQELLTQGNGGRTAVGRFVTNDGVHVYRAWGVFHQAFTANTFTLAGYRQATAAEAMARAQQEIAKRGLNVVVTQAYYALVVAERQYSTAQQGLDQAARSLKISQELEKGGEVAYSDVITFQIQYNQQKQAFQQAKLAMKNARLSLAVLLFPNFNQDFNVVDDLGISPPLPPLADALKMAEVSNPEIRAAMADVRQTRYGVSVARAAFLPTLSFDLDYGIEANYFALRSINVEQPEAGRLPNLGFFLTATLNVPVWDWGARLSRLRQAKYQRDQARVQLTYTQRQVLANLYSYYNEARTARAELGTLRSSANLAAESLRLNTLRYKAGDATVLEVLNAENTLTQARDSYATGLARYRVALAYLQTLTGSF
ncbi:MAG: TolC family protein [Acidobacteria bacterium]|nr:TolC family protein [Acidobacteriota bacterium]